MNTFRILGEGEMISTPQIQNNNGEIYVSKDIINDPRRLLFFLNNSKLNTIVNELFDVELHGYYKDSKYYLDSIFPDGFEFITSIGILFRNYDKKNDIVLIKTNFDLYEGTNLINDRIVDQIKNIDTTPSAQEAISSLKYKPIDDLVLKKEDSVLYNPSNN